MYILAVFQRYVFCCTNKNFRQEISPTYSLTIFSYYLLLQVPVKEVYEQIIADFTESMTLLEGWVRPNKVKINKNVAAGLFSRIHWVMENWTEAAKYARIAREGASVLTIDEYKAEGFNDINTKSGYGEKDFLSLTICG